MSFYFLFQISLQFLPYRHLMKHLKPHHPTRCSPICPLSYHCGVKLVTGSIVQHCMAICIPNSISPIIRAPFGDYLGQSLLHDSLLLLYLNIEPIAGLMRQEQHLLFLKGIKVKEFTCRTVSRMALCGTVRGAAPRNRKISVIVASKYGKLEYSLDTE